MMKKYNLKLMTLILCLLISTLIFPKNSLAISAPLAPVNLTATVTSTNQIYLTWDPVSSATGYYIYRATSSSGYYTIIATPSTTSYIDSSLELNTAYYYKVQAVNYAGASSYSAIVYATTINSNGALSAPIGLNATVAGGNQINLTWNPVSYATYYYVYRATSPSGNYTIISVPTTASYSDSSLSLNTTYYYKVQAVNSAGSSSYSAIVYGTTTNSSSTLSVPTNLTATVASSNQINLTWNPVSYATFYYVSRATSPSGDYTIIAMPTIPSYTDSSLSLNTAYYYKVQAVNSAGSSSYSSIVYGTTNNSNGALSVPTNLTATVANSNQINLTWNPVSNATYYYVSRSTSPSGDYTIIAVPTTPSYINTDLLTNTTYYYKVQAVNSAGSSSFSAIVYGTTTNYNGALSAPTNLTATVANSNQLYLTWNPVSNATYYYVFRATSPSDTYTNIATLTTTSYTDYTLPLNSTYCYKVQAMNSSGLSSYSSIVYATTITSNGSLSAPTNLTATVANSNQINLTWNPVSYATTYYVYRATSYSGPYTIIATPTTSNYINTDLSINTTYYYKVQAVNSAGSSLDSSIVYATTTNTNGTLLAPTNLTGTSANSNQINLTWNPVSYATYYYVYRATSPSDTYTNIATITTTNYTDSNLSLNTTYYYKVQAVNSAGLSSFSSVTNVTTAPAGTSSQIKSERLAGNDMYETSVEVAKSGWKTSYYAVIVSGENFSDALCSAPLAQKHNAPLLLTSKDILNAQTKIELSRLKVKNVIIIGGVGVISSVVEQSIKNMGIEVSRIAGNDRYETSIKIAQSLGQFNQAVVACGESFPDALSIAPIAAMKGMPILLTPKDNLPENIKTYLLKNVQSTYVVGGTGVVSENVLKQLPSPKRLSGLTRYETNISIIKEFADQLDFSLCYISTGENFADALAGSALASLTNSPVILVRDPVDQSTLDFLRSKVSSIQKKVVFGGTIVVPESILVSLNGTTNGSNTPSTPTDITATTVSSSQINLTWNSVSGATSYYIYGSTSSSGTYSHIGTTTTTIYLNTSLWADTTYYYKVQAVNSAGSSSYSPIAYAKTTLSDY